MSLYHNLLDVSQETTNVVIWISVGAVFVLLLAIAAICFKGQRGYDSKHIAAAAIAIALSFALSFAKVPAVPNGGSITLASFVPILIYAYVYGFADGLLAGIIFGLLNFISNPYILTPATFILDYPLAFASIGVMGFCKHFAKKQTIQVVLGTIAVFVVRFIFHLCSGFVYFAENSIWVSFPEWALSNAFIYSFIYQCVYLPADCAIAAITLYLLSKTKVLDKLISIIKPQKKRSDN